MDAGLDEAVDGRRDGLLVVEVSEIAVSDVIAHDEEHIRWRSG